MQSTHDHLHKQERGLGRLAVVRKIALNAAFFLAAKRWIGENYVEPFLQVSVRLVVGRALASTSS